MLKRNNGLKNWPVGKELDEHSVFTVAARGIKMVQNNLCPNKSLQVDLKEK